MHVRGRTEVAIDVDSQVANGVDRLNKLSHVVCVCVYVLGTRVSCAKMAEPIEMEFGWREADSYDTIRYGGFACAQKLMGWPA